VKENHMNKEERGELNKKLHEDIDAIESRVKHLMQDDDLVDEDGYPTDNALEIVRIWHWIDAKGYFEFIRSIWWAPDWGWKEKDEPHDFQKDQMVHRYYISTGGWSGNESIIRAMQENQMMWTFNWVQSRRGGHYIFEMRVFEDE
jgi:hypothetical protein